MINILDFWYFRRCFAVFIVRSYIEMVDVLFEVGGIAGRPWCQHQPEEQAWEDAPGCGRGGSQSVP